MRSPLRAVAARQHGAFTAQQALLWYVPGEVRARIRSGRWLRVHGRTYRLRGSEPGPRLRVAAAGLSIGRPLPACLHTAAELHGFGVLDDPTTHVAVDPGQPCRRRDGLWPLQLALDPPDLVTLRCGALATTVDRTAVELARCLPLVEAGPESPQESRLRLRCLDAGLPRPAADRRRHNVLQDAGWAMFYATDLDVYGRNSTLLEQVGAAIRRRGGRWGGGAGRGQVSNL